MPEDYNSFKELEKLTSDQYADNISKVKKSVDNNISSMSFITNIIDMYFSKVVSYVVNLSGGDSDKEKE